MAFMDIAEAATTKATERGTKNSLHSGHPCGEFRARKSWQILQTARSRPRQPLDLSPLPFFPPSLSLPLSPSAPPSLSFPRCYFGTVLGTLDAIALIHSAIFYPVFSTRLFGGNSREGRRGKEEGE